MVSLGELKGVSPEYLHKAEFMLVVRFTFVFGTLQTVGHMRPRSHVQLFSNPLERHTRLGPQPLRNPDFPHVALRTLRQLCLCPTQFVQFFAQN